MDKKDKEKMGRYSNNPLTSMCVVCGKEIEVLDFGMDVCEECESFFDMVADVQERDRASDIEDFFEEYYGSTGSAERRFGGGSYEQ